MSKNIKMKFSAIQSLLQKSIQDGGKRGLEGRNDDVIRDSQETVLFPISSPKCPSETALKNALDYNSTVENPTLGLKDKSLLARCFPRIQK